jgi:hypothetical protein
MEYSQQHLLNWLKEHNLIKIAGLEEEVGLPKDTVRHFVKERRNLQLSHFDLVVNKLKEYGYSNT